MGIKFAMVLSGCQLRCDFWGGHSPDLAASSIRLMQGWPPPVGLVAACVHPVH